MKKRRKNKIKMQGGRFLVWLLLLVVGCSGIVFANTKEEYQNRKERYYLSVEIEKGDTIWDIAEKYRPEGWGTRKFMDEITKFNGIDSGKILPGQHILIPIYP